MRRPLDWWTHYQAIDGIDVFAVDLSPGSQRESRALALLDDDEKVRYSRFHSKDSRRQFLLSRAALRLVLGQRLNTSPSALAFGTERFGKPFAIIDGAPAPIAFNISHSGRDGLIAVTRSRSVGIDLEQRRPLPDLYDIAERVFHDSEIKTLSLVTESARQFLFYRIWTLKEAVIKARGTGFSYDPVNFQIPEAILQGGRTAAFRYPEESRPQWFLMDLGADRYAAALAYRSSSQLGEKLTIGGR